MIDAYIISEQSAPDNTKKYKFRGIFTFVSCKTHAAVFLYRECAQCDEGVTHLDAGRPMVVRKPESQFNLANFFRATLYSSMATLKIGMDILAHEGVGIDSLTGHGGLFKTPVVGQKYLAAACSAPVSCMETAGEGGPYGMALLAAYRANKASGETLEDYLNGHVFAGVCAVTMEPDKIDVDGFDTWLRGYKALLDVERKAVEVL